MSPADTPRKTAPHPPRRWSRRWWWRWTRRTAITAVLLRVLLALFLLPLVDFGAGFAGLTVSWRRASLSLSGLSLHLDDVLVRDAEHPDRPPLLAAQEVFCDLSLRQLLGGRLSVVDVALAGARITVERDAQGRLLLPTVESADEARAPEAPDGPEEPKPWRFDPLLRIASARLHDLQFALVDRATTPPTTYRATLDLDVADFGFADRDGTASLRLVVPDRLDELSLVVHTAAAPPGAERANASFQAAVRGLRPHAFDLPSAVLDSLDGAHVIDLRGQGELHLRALANAPMPAIDGRVEFAADLDGIERSSLAATFGPTQPAGEALATPFAFTFAADGLVDSLRLADGRLSRFDDRVEFAAALRTDGLTGARLRPLLAAAGITLPADGIALTAGLSGAFGERLELAIDDLHLGDGTGLGATLDHLLVRDLHHDAARLSIGAVEIVGPDLALVREPDGTLIVAGVRLAPPSTAGVPPPAPRANPAPSAATPALPHLHLGSFDWTGARISLQDQSCTPTRSLALADLEVHAAAVSLGAVAPPGKVEVSFAVPDAIGACTAELTLTPQADGLAAEVRGSLRRITLASLRPWLAPLGIEPEWRAGRARFGANAEVTIDERGIRCDAELADLLLQDGDVRWLSLRRLRGEGLRVGDDGFDAGTWTVQEPFVKLHLDEHQRLHALGLAFGAATEPAAPARPAVARPSRRTRRGDDAPPFRHGAVRVREAVAAWTSAAHGERVFAIGLDAELGADSGRGAPVPIEVAVRLDRAVQELRATAELQRNPTRALVAGTITARGVQGAELQPLLPPGTRCTLVDGELRAGFRVEVATGETTALTAELRDLTLRDRSAEVFAADEILAKLPQLADDQVHVEDLHVHGLRLAVAHTRDALQVPGFACSTAPPPASADEEPTPAATPTSPRTLPKLRIDAFAVQLDRLEYRDRIAADAEPLVLHGTLRLARPWRGDPAADEPETLTLQLTGEGQPFGARLAATARISPFALAPTIDLDWRLEDCDTTALARVLPSLADRVRGEATRLTAGASVHLRLDLKRRDPAQFDLSRPFGLEFSVADLALGDAASGTDYLRLAGLDARVRAIDPDRGDVLVRDVDIDAPTLFARRDVDGLHVAGLVLAPPAPARESDAEPAAEDDGDDGPEFAIARLRLLGLAVDYRDETTDPPTHLHFTDSDAELARFTTRAFHEPLPLSFSVAVRGGDVELTRRVIKSSVLSGLLSSGAELLAGGRDQHERQSRPLLDQFVATGNLTLFPRPKGHIEARLDRLELPALRGLAKQGGVELADGLYDMRMRIDLRGYDGVDVDSEHVFTWLQLSEPPDGPISTYLRLPAPLQTVLFLLRNADDEQRLPIRLHVPADGVRTGAIVDLVAESLVRLIGDAVGDAGSRALGMLTDPLLGSNTETPDIAVELPFAPGSELPQDGDLTALLAAVRADATLKIVLTHELGAGDREHMAALANPPAEVVARTLRRLRAERTRLERSRPALADEVVALHAAGKNHEAQRSFARLRALDTELGELLATEAEALERLAATSPRAAARRTREAARQLAAARLDATTARLLQAMPGLPRSRIERRPGRGLPTEGLTAGGRVVATLRRSAVESR
ncbi:MAG TPA: DUF748 domain-containing protein [bacterium]|nr:DUF748 domain-containing protein [bacterium]